MTIPADSGKEFVPHHFFFSSNSLSTFKSEVQEKEEIEEKGEKEERETARVAIAQAGVRKAITFFFSPTRLWSKKRGKLLILFPTGCYLCVLFNGFIAPVECFWESGVKQS